LAQASTISRPEVEGTPFDLLLVPLLGSFLRWRHSRTVLQAPLLIVSVLMILHGFLGPSLAPKNLATVLTWLHFRGLLALVILAAGNFFCLACPFMLVRNAARKIFRPRWNWPRALRNKWLSVGLFVLILFMYELFGLWASPWGTAWLIVAYFGTVLIVDGLFKHASFCKFVCPLGQFNYAASLISPLEVAVRDQQVCTGCKTKDCIRGERQPGPDLVILQRGCELALFLPRKVGNMDCTFCLDCVHACPHDNVGILSRSPAEELMSDPTRSGIGMFSRRPDMAALMLVFTFGALLNAFGMVSPAYVVERWLASLLHVSQKAPVLATVFTGFLLVEPIVLLGGAAWITGKLRGSPRPLVPLMVRYSYALVPLGFGMWLAHYGFHLLTGLFTIIPVVQSAAASVGVSLLGKPQWLWVGIPSRFVQPVQLGFVILGLFGSLLITRRLADEDCPKHPMRAFIPWTAVCLVIWLAAVWLLLQPMEMRATMLMSS
jgi:polyferredoxin